MLNCADQVYLACCSLASGAVEAGWGTGLRGLCRQHGSTAGYWEAVLAVGEFDAGAP